MKSAVFETLGKPWEVLQLQDVPMPEPGEGEVRIKVTTCNINPSDIMFVQGMYGIRPELPGVGGLRLLVSSMRSVEGPASRRVHV